MTEERTWRSGVSCGYCRKVSYPTKRTAKTAARALYPAEHLTAYPCPYGGTGWHFGHLDEALRARRGRDIERAESA